MVLENNLPRLAKKDIKLCQRVNKGLVMSKGDRQDLLSGFWLDQRFESLFCVLFEFLGVPKRVRSPALVGTKKLPPPRSLIGGRELIRQLTDGVMNRAIKIGQFLGREDVITIESIGKVIVGEVCAGNC